ncbi:hypothetical protein [Ottowia sp.]|uniref:hypothetical protein n=1 Tax=Ottowia sp. TaxID=1898956 RepID=UPI0025E833A6|nr:hypothetical protein [Ottowia sp.]
MKNKPKGLPSPRIEAMKLEAKIARHKMLAAAMAQYGPPPVWQRGITQHEREQITRRAARIRDTRMGKPARPTRQDLALKGI